MKICLFFALLMMKLVRNWFVVVVYKLKLHCRSLTVVFE